MLDEENHRVERHEIGPESFLIRYHLPDFYPNASFRRELRPIRSLTMTDRFAVRRRLHASSERARRSNDEYSENVPRFCESKQIRH